MEMGEKEVSLAGKSLDKLPARVPKLILKFIF